MSEIITRAEALERGLNRYFTGLPCVHGHVAERVMSSTSRGACMECRRLIAQRPHNRKADNVAHRESYLRPEVGARKRDAKRIHRAGKLGHVPPPAEMDCPPRPADGLCDCCLDPVAGKHGFHLDHDHVTGAFRGWTCGGCNTGTGIVDSPDRLRTRAEFLRCELPWQ